jgi:CO/xanthine dehydrogenase Mo-binding subunit
MSQPPKHIRRSRPSLPGPISRKRVWPDADAVQRRAGGAGYRQGAVPGPGGGLVVAEDRYSARDALELIDVDYDALAPVIDARKALDADAEVIRTDLEGKADNHCFDWETGDAAATEAAFAKADVVVKQEIVYPRVHPAPMEPAVP